MSSTSFPPPNVPLYESLMQGFFGTLSASEKQDLWNKFLVENKLLANPTDTTKALAFADYLQQVYLLESERTGKEITNQNKMLMVTLIDILVSLLKTFSESFVKTQGTIQNLANQQGAYQEMLKKMFFYVGSGAMREVDKSVLYNGGEYPDYSSNPESLFVPLDNTSVIKMPTTTTTATTTVPSSRDSSQTIITPNADPSQFVVGFGNITMEDIYNFLVVNAKKSTNTPPNATFQLWGTDTPSRTERSLNKPWTIGDGEIPTKNRTYLSLETTYDPATDSYSITSQYYQIHFSYNLVTYSKDPATGEDLERSPLGGLPVYYLEWVPNMDKPQGPGKPSGSDGTGLTWIGTPQTITGIKSTELSAIGKTMHTATMLSWNEAASYSKDQVGWWGLDQYANALANQDHTGPGYSRYAKEWLRKYYDPKIPWQTGVLLGEANLGTNTATNPTGENKITNATDIQTVLTQVKKGIDTRIALNKIQQTRVDQMKAKIELVRDKQDQQKNVSDAAFTALNQGANILQTIIRELQNVLSEIYR